MKPRLSALLIALLAAGCSGDKSAEPAADAGATAATDASAAPALGSKGVLNVYNWSDYIADDTIANFEKETGVDVTYDVYDSNEVLEAKLLSGNTGYDIVLPSLSPFLTRQIQAGVYQPLDKSRFKNYGNLDPALMAILASNDPGNDHAIPYLWGTTGIGYNVDKVKAALGDGAALDTWAMVLEPENLAKLKGCGVAMLDTPIEIIPPVLRYLGQDPNSTDPAVIQLAVDRLQLLRPSITYFHSSQYIDDLANGDICIAIGWSGDIIQARDRAAEAAKGVNVAYTIPKEGAPMWFDMLAIPKDAKNVDNAYLFLDYLMRPDVMAGVQNYVMYASANQAALPLVDKVILDDPGIYPTEEAKKGLFTLVVHTPEVDRLLTRHWTTLKTGQ